MRNVWNKKMWELLCWLGGVMILCVLSSPISVHADFTRFYPFTQDATSPIWIYPVHQEWMKLSPEEDALYYDPLIDEDGQALWKGDWDKQNVNSAYEGIWEFETKYSGNGNFAQRVASVEFAPLVAYSEAADMSVCAATRSYTVTMGNPGDDRNKWFLEIRSSTGTQIQSSPYILNSTGFDLDVWRHVKIQLSTVDDPNGTGATAGNKIVSTTVFVEGETAIVVRESVPGWFVTGVTHSFMRFQFDGSGGPLTPQRKYIRNIKYYTVDEEPASIPLVGLVTEKILGIGVPNDAAFMKDYNLSVNERIGGRMFASVGQLGSFLWDGYTGNIIRFKASTYPYSKIAFTSDNDYMLTGGNNQGVASAQLLSVTSGDVVMTYQGNFLSFSPDDSLVLMGEWQKAKLYNTMTGVYTGVVLEGHTGEIVTAKFTSDGNYIITASEDRTVKVWETYSGKLLKTFSGHTLGINCMDLYYSGNLNDLVVVTGSKDNTAIVWNYSTGSGVTLTGHSGAINAIAIAADGSKVVTGSEDKSVKVWLPTGGEDSGFAGSHTLAAAVSRVIFSSTADIVLAGCPQETKSWLVGTGALKKTYTGRLLDTWNTLTNALSEVLTFDREGLKLWNVHTGEIIRLFKGHNNPILSTDFSSNQQLALSIINDGTITEGSVKVWDLNGIGLNNLQKIALKANTGALSPNGLYLLTGHTDGTARVWNIATGMPIYVLSGQHTGAVTSVAYSSDGDRILTGGQDGKAVLWNAVNGSFIRSFAHSTSQAVTKVAFNADRTKVISSGGGTVRIWNVVGGGSIGGPISETFLAVSPDGNKLLTAGIGDNATGASIWNINTGSKIASLIGHTDIVTSGVFTAASDMVVTGSLDKTLILWDAARGTLTRTFTGATKGIRSVAVSKNNNMIAAGDEGYALRIWNYKTGATITSYSSHNGIINSLYFSTDESQILTGSDDGSARLFTVSSATGDYQLSIVSDLSDYVKVPGTGTVEKSFSVRMSNMGGLSAYRLVIASTRAVMNMKVTSVTTFNTSAESWGAATIQILNSTNNTNVPVGEDWAVISINRGINSPLPSGAGSILRFNMVVWATADISIPNAFEMRIECKPTSESNAVAQTRPRTFIDQNAITYANIVESVTSTFRSGLRPSPIAWTGLYGSNASTEQFFLWGDVDGNNLADANDADLIMLNDAFLLSAWPGYASVTPPDAPKAADVSGDGVVGGLDAGLILRFDAFLITWFTADTNHDGYGPESTATKTAHRANSNSPATDPVKLSASINSQSADQWLVKIGVNNTDQVQSVRLVLSYDVSKVKIDTNSIKWLVNDPFAKLVVNNTNGRLVISGALSQPLESGSSDLIALAFAANDTAAAGSLKVEVDSSLTRINDGNIPLLAESMKEIQLVGGTGVADWTLY